MGTVTRASFVEFSNASDDVTDTLDGVRLNATSVEHNAGSTVVNGGVHHARNPRRPPVAGASIFETVTGVSMVRLIRSRESVKTLGQEPVRRSFRIGSSELGKGRSTR